MKNIFDLIVEILMMVLSFCVFPLVFAIGFVYTLLKHIYKLDYSLKKQLQPIIRSISLVNDGLACAGGGEMLNDILKIKGNIKYGKWNQTISEVSGLILVFSKQDTRLRRFVDKAFKVFQKEHCVSAISEQNNFYYKYNNQIPQLMKNST